MHKYLARRLLQAVPIVLGVTVLVFAFANLAPGDPVDALIPPDMPITQELRDRWREEMGLNDPLPVRYLQWLSRLARGSLGYSLSQGRRPIGDLILERLPATLSLLSFSLILSTALGVATGVLAAIRQYSFWDYALTFAAFVWLSIPGFFLALIMIYVFAVKLGSFPTSGMSSPGAASAALNRIHHFILPGVTLGLELTASLTRYVRSSMLEVLHSDYLRTARAKGLPERRVVLRHALPNALIPAITVIGLRLPALFGGSVVIETMFQWPGIGLLALTAATQRDYPLVTSLALITTVLVVLSSLLTDVAYAVIDPRIRYD